MNGWSQQQTDSYLETVWNTWHTRSHHDWSLDFAWLKHHDIHISSQR